MSFVRIWLLIIGLHWALAQSCRRSLGSRSVSGSCGNPCPALSQPNPSCNLPAQCCTTTGPCRVAEFDADGDCIDETQCEASGLKVAFATSEGATGCQVDPNNIKCCIFKSDMVAPTPMPPTPKPPTPQPLTPKPPPNATPMPPPNTTPMPPNGPTTQAPTTPAPLTQAIGCAVTGCAPPLVCRPNVVCEQNTALHCNNGGPACQAPQQCLPSGNTFTCQVAPCVTENCPAGQECRLSNGVEQCLPKIIISGPSPKSGPDWLTTPIIIAIAGGAVCLCLLLVGCGVAICCLLVIPNRNKNYTYDGSTVGMYHEGQPVGGGAADWGTGSYAADEMGAYASEMNEQGAGYAGASGFTQEFGTSGLGSGEYP